MILIVIGEYILSGAEQPLNLRVVLGDKFNDQKAALNYVHTIFLKLINETMCFIDPSRPVSRPLKT